MEMPKVNLSLFQPLCESTAGVSNGSKSSFSLGKLLPAHSNSAVLQGCTWIFNKERGGFLTITITLQTAVLFIVISYFAKGFSSSIGR